MDIHDSFSRPYHKSKNFLKCFLQLETKNIATMYATMLLRLHRKTLGELENPKKFWLTWHFTCDWPMDIVRPGKKIRKIWEPFINTFSTAKKIQFRYVVNLLHKTSIELGWVQKSSKFKHFSFAMLTLPIHTIPGGAKLGFLKKGFSEPPYCPEYSLISKGW